MPGQRRSFLYAQILRRCLAWRSARRRFFCGCLGYLYSRLPSTFMVPAGQALTLAQMPWLVPLQQSGAAAAEAVPAGSSYNTTLSLFGKVPVKTVRAVVVDRRAVTVCGTPFGIKMFSGRGHGGGLYRPAHRQWIRKPAKAAGLKMGIC